MSSQDKELSATTVTKLVKEKKIIMSNNSSSNRKMMQQGGHSRRNSRTGGSSFHRRNSAFAHNHNHNHYDHNDTCDQVDTSVLDNTTNNYTYDYSSNYQQQHHHQTSNNNNSTTNNTSFRQSRQQIYEQELENLLRQNEETWIIYTSGKFKVEYQNGRGAAKKIILKEKSESDSDWSISDYHIKKFKVQQKLSNTSSQPNETTIENNTTYERTLNSNDETNVTNDNNNNNNQINANFIEVHITDVNTSNVDEFITGPGSELIKRLVNGSDVFSPTASLREFQELTNNIQMQSQQAEHQLNSSSSPPQTYTEYYDAATYFGLQQQQQQAAPQSPPQYQANNYSYSQTNNNNNNAYDHYYQQQQQQAATTNTYYQQQPSSFDQMYYNQRQQQNYYSQYQMPSSSYGTVPQQTNNYYSQMNYQQQQQPCTFSAPPQYNQTSYNNNYPYGMASHYSSHYPYQTMGAYQQQHQQQQQSSYLPHSYQMNYGGGQYQHANTCQPTSYLGDLNSYAASRHYHLLKSRSDDDDNDSENIIIYEDNGNCSDDDHHHHQHQHRYHGNNKTSRGKRGKGSKRLSGSVRRALETFNNEEDIDNNNCYFKTNSNNANNSNTTHIRRHQMITSYHGSRLSSGRPMSSQYDQTGEIEVCESTSGEELEELELEPKEKTSQFSGIETTNHNCIKVESRGVRESFIKSGCQSSSGNIMVGLLDAQEALSIGPGSLAGGSLFEGVLPSNFDTASQRQISAKQSQVNDEKSAFSEYNKDDDDEDGDREREIEGGEEDDENESQSQEQKSQLIFQEKITKKQLETAFNSEVAKYGNNSKIPISKLYKVFDALNISIPSDDFNKATYLLGFGSTVSYNKLVDLLGMLDKFEKSASSTTLLKPSNEDAEVKYIMSLYLNSQLNESLSTFANNLIFYQQQQQQ